MDKSNQKSLNETIQNLNKVDAPKNITEGFFQSPEQKALNASLIQSIVEATSIEPLDESGKARAARKRAAWQRGNSILRAGREPRRSPSNGEVYDDVNKIHSKIALKALRPYRDSNERPLTKRERSILKQTETRNPGRAKTKASIGRYDERNALIIKGQENARFSRANATKGPHVARPSVSNPGTLSKEDSAEKRAYQAYKREAAAAELAKPRLPKLRKESFEPIDEGEARDRRRWASWQRQYTKGSYNPKELPSEYEYERLRNNHSRRMKKRAEQTANREAEAKNESFEPIDEGEARDRRRWASWQRQYTKGSYNPKELPSEYEYERLRNNHSRRMKKRAEQTANREAEAKNESFEPIDEGGMAKGKRLIKSALKKLKKPTPEIKGLLNPEVLVTSRRNNALGMLEKGINRINQSQVSRDFRKKNESVEPIDESGEAKARREVESAHRKLKRPIPHYKGLVPEVIAGLARKELALNTLDRGVRRLRGSMSSRELRNQNNESFEDKLKFAHIVKRLSKSALAARAARIMARNEEFDGIAEEADETPKPKRVRKPKAATPTPTPAPAPAKVKPKRVVVKPKAAATNSTVKSKRVVVKPKAAATNSTVKSKRVSPFENLFAGERHKLSSETLRLKKEYDQYRKQGHSQIKATDMVYAGVKAEGDKKNAIRNRILNTPREPSTLDKIVSKVGSVASKIGAAAQAIRNPEDLANRGARKLARGTGRVVGKIGRGIQSAAKEYFKTPYRGQEKYPGAKPSAATIAFHKKGSDTSPAPTKAKSKRGSIKPKTSAPAVYAYESIKVNEVNSTLGKLQAARKRRKTARLALNNSVIVDQTNLVNEAKPSEAVRRGIRSCS